MSSLKLIRLAALIGVLSGYAAGASAGIQLGGTRVIFDASVNPRETTLEVANKDKAPYLIQPFLDQGALSGRETPFMVTPPLKRLDGGKSQVLQIRASEKVKDLPKDRESVYWLNVKEIPPVDAKTSGQNMLRLVVDTRIKLFYRPAGLKGDPSQAGAQLSWTVVPGVGKEGAALRVANPTPYHVSFATLEVKGAHPHKIRDQIMVAPKSTMDIVVPGDDVDAHAPVQLAYSTINDAGSPTPSIDVTAQPLRKAASGVASSVSAASGEVAHATALAASGRH
ncbi:molecular chaperone [Burkholderia ubonensis]|uniref:Molecular chaperone n=1 Tax=Burkholderia ubonensis TaxID=101571 RepID=A0AAW3MMV9_9BURK|nr:molecular chaperone [Burkholderia ubonensis]KVK98966.1 hypothetical protein WJ45_15925 [Burkholderia ubonensis]KVN83134.1 hypothetical protein WJ67_04515 [Burkholderia ubonensis]KVP89364.1 hypothetical protein WJ96_20440 [Burkholderia ubonensis]KVQ54162.1 hypothetical protein WK04_02670 [Burkholderia ubonensis]KWD49502.1 hypothetical protein WL66_20100 [Burkholderia ubonensis]